MGTDQFLNVESKLIKHWASTFLLGCRSQPLPSEWAREEHFINLSFPCSFLSIFLILVFQRGGLPTWEGPGWLCHCFPQSSSVLILGWKLGWKWSNHQPKVNKFEVEIPSLKKWLKFGWLEIEKKADFWLIIATCSTHFFLNLMSKLWNSWEVNLCPLGWGT